MQMQWLSSVNRFFVQGAASACALLLIAVPGHTAASGSSNGGSEAVALIRQLPADELPMMTAIFGGGAANLSPEKKPDFSDLRRYVELVNTGKFFSFVHGALHTCEFPAHGARKCDDKVSFDAKTDPGPALVFSLESNSGGRAALTLASGFGSLVATSNVSYDQHQIAISAGGMGFRDFIFVTGPTPYVPPAYPNGTSNLVCPNGVDPDRIHCTNEQKAILDATVVLELRIKFTPLRPSSVGAAGMSAILTDPANGSVSVRGDKCAAYLLECTSGVIDKARINVLSGARLKLKGFAQLNAVDSPNFGKVRSGDFESIVDAKVCVVPITPGVHLRSTSGTDYSTGC
jgi:hypothetical protein